MRLPGLAGVMWAGRGQSAGLAPPIANAAGNNLPGITGARFRDMPRGPAAQNVAGGQLGAYDGTLGADPRAAKRQPFPKSPDTPAWGEGDSGDPGGKFAPPLPYGGLGTFTGRGFGNQTGVYGDPVGHGRQSFERYALQGFNDQLTVKDRHAYWDTGNQKTGVDFSAPGAPPNTYNNPREEPPRPDLRTINRTVSYQRGSDKTWQQDDFTRPYTWLGEQGSGWTPVYGGVPGLYQPYGSRGGVPFPLVSSAEYGQPGDGPHLVHGGPPHGLHSQTPWKGGAQIIGRFASTPQTRPVRVDRPSNSPQAGQSYSQTVVPQGGSPVRPAARRAGGRVNPAAAGWVSGRGWAGQVKPTQGGQTWVNAWGRRGAQ